MSDQSIDLSGDWKLSDANGDYVCRMHVPGDEALDPVDDLEAPPSDGERSPVTASPQAPPAPVDPRIGEGPHRILEGRCVERLADGTFRPYPDCMLEVGPASPPTLATADGEGRFRIELSGGDFRAASVMLSTAVDPLGGLLNWSRRIDFADGQQVVSGVTVVLSPVPDFVGVVVDPAGEPVADFLVVAPNNGTARTDAAGRFNMGRLRAESYGNPRGLAESLSSDHAEGLILSAEIPGFDGEGVWGEARLVAAPAVTLTVQGRDAGSAVSLPRALNVRIRAGHPLEVANRWSDRLTEDREGASVAVVPAGVALQIGDDFTLVDRSHVLRREGFGGAASAIVLTEDTTLRLPVVQSVRLSGTVLEADGTGSGGAIVEAFAPGEVFPGVGTKADERGTFDFEVAVSPDAPQVVVRASSARGMREGRGFFFGPRYADPLQRAEEVVSLAGPPGAGQDLTLHLETYPAIRGRVADPEGLPLKGVQLWIEDLDARGPVGNDWTISNHDGTFEFRQLRPASYRLLARSIGRGSATLESVSPGGPPLEILLGPESMARVEVTVTAPGSLARLQIGGATLYEGSGRAAATIRPSYGPHGGGVFARDGTFTSDDGEWRGAMMMRGVQPGSSHVLTLPAGACWIVAKGEDENGVPTTLVGTGPVRLDAGQEAAITLRLAPAGAAQFALRGAPGRVLRVVDPATGEPVPAVGPGGNRRDEFPLGASGELRLEGLPAIPLEAWTGTRDRVRSGSPEARVRFTPRAGDVVRVDG